MLTQMYSTQPKFTQLPFFNSKSAIEFAKKLLK